MERVQQLDLIQEKLRQRQYRLTSHAEQEREAEKITIKEIEESLQSPKAEIIESYPDDPRGTSCLLLGFDKNRKPLHVVCGLGVEMLVTITVYRPNPEQWVNWRTRRPRL